MYGSLTELLSVQFIRLIRENHPSISESRGGLSSLPCPNLRVPTFSDQEGGIKVVQTTLKLANILPEHNHLVHILEGCRSSLRARPYFPSAMIMADVGSRGSCTQSYAHT
mgnify:CR=1 FL=1|jgi:hypothetical protein